MFSMIFCLFLILVWCELYAAIMCVNLVCLHAYECYCLSVLDSNDTECTEEREVFECQEEEEQ
jgi:hypothetical protein